MDINIALAFALAYLFIVFFTLMGDVTGRKEGALTAKNIEAVLVRSAVYLAIIIAGYVVYTFF